MEMTPARLAMQRVVCAAVLSTKTGTIVTGARHFDELMRKSLNTIKALDETPHDYAKNQGFIDQFGNFLTREEAYEIAEKRGQIIRECGNKGQRTLYSEHLY